MTCQCEIYEICPSCAPSPAAFEKAVRDHDEVLRQVESSSPSYTLKEIEALAWVFVDSNDASGDQDAPDAIKLRMFMGAFLAWFAKREREGLG